MRKFDPRLEQCPKCDLVNHGKCKGEPLDDLKVDERCRSFVDEPQGYHEDEVSDNPMYGMVSISNVTCGAGVPMVGSSMRHNHYMSIRVHKARRSRSIHHERLHSSELLLSLDITPNQFIDLLTGMNTQGIPCTLRFYSDPESGEPVNKVHDEAPADESIRKTYTEFEDQCDIADSYILELKRRVEALAERGKPVGKRALEELARDIDSASHQVNSNMKFIRDTFNKNVKNVVSEAKGEIESFANDVARITGVQALKGKSPELHESVQNLIEQGE